MHQDAHTSDMQKLMLRPHTLEPPHYTYPAILFCLLGGVATGVATGLMT